MTGLSTCQVNFHYQVALLVNAQARIHLLGLDLFLWIFMRYRYLCVVMYLFLLFVLLFFCISFGCYKVKQLVFIHHDDGRFGIQLLCLIGIFAWNLIGSFSCFPHVFLIYLFILFVVVPPLLFSISQMHVQSAHRKRIKKLC